jgi:outer membrane protein insertion porin family
MRQQRIRRGIRTCVTAAFLVALAGLVSFGSGSPAEAAVVSRVVVEGNQRVDAETIQAYLLVQPGQNFSAQDVDESLKALFETGLFADVQINQSGGALVVRVVENPIINEIAFEGNRKFKDEQLSTVLQSKPRDVFTRAKVQNDVQRILEIYRRSGRYQASVTPQTIELPNNRVNLVFEIADGPNTGVSGIIFIGNQAYGDQRLRTVINTRQSGLLGFLRSTDIYDPDRLASDEEKLRSYYLDRGYADFQVISSVADLDRERNAFFITFTVEEGPQYRFGQIFVDSSIPGVDTAVLDGLVTTDAGDVFSSAEVDESLEILTLQLAGSGYPFAQVRPRLDRDPTSLTIGVTYVIDEGARTYVERIDVRGNARTRDYVIRREFDIAEGDAFNRVLVDRAERRLKNLGYFTEVRIATEPGSAPDRVVVVVDVVEQPTGELSFGAGYSTGDGIVGDISLTERNFLGRGYNVRVAVGGGESTRNYEFGFTDPYFLGRRISAGFNVFRREFDESDFRSYEYDATGGGLTFGFPITEDFTVQLGYQLEYKEIAVDNFEDRCDYGQPDPDPDDGIDHLANNVSRAICEAADEGDTLTSSVLYSLIYDTLDSRRDPRDGALVRFTQEFAGVGGDVSFLRTTGTGSYYHELLPDRDLIGFVKLQGGHIMGIGEDVRLLDSFFKGGETIRGFKGSGFGPRDLETGDALGGTTFVAGTAEVQFPLPGIPPEIGLKGAFFADAGTLFGTDFEDTDDTDVADEASIRSSVGGSILWASPIGPLRADFAHVISKEDYDEEQFFRIGGGARF